VSVDVLVEISKGVCVTLDPAAIAKDNLKNNIRIVKNNKYFFMFLPSYETHAGGLSALGDR
jgi:hypothetical protein